MEDILKFKLLNQLKNTYRANSVGNRKESSAEHSWSCLLLADYFFNLTPVKVDKLKVYELLMYHDVVEIEAGDTPLDPNQESLDKKEREFQAAMKIKGDLPAVMQGKFFELFVEFEEQKTIEAKFAKVIDHLDAIIHELDYKEDWKGWSEEFLRSKKEKFFEDFPEMKKAFEKLIGYLNEHDYFEK